MSLAAKEGWFCVETLRNRDGSFHISHAQALARLREISWLDFGLDADAWEKWAKENGQWHSRPIGIENEHA